ncbi:MAG: hypothetical protein ACYTF3_00365 [Planctomycetota bacterium]
MKNPILQMRLARASSICVAMILALACSHGGLGGGISPPADLANALGESELVTYSGPRNPDGVWAPQGWHYWTVHSDGSIGTAEAMVVDPGEYSGMTLREIFASSRELSPPWVAAGRVAQASRSANPRGSIIWAHPDSNARSLLLAMLLTDAVADQKFIHVGDLNTLQVISPPAIASSSSERVFIDWGHKMELEIIERDDTEALVLKLAFEDEITHHRGLSSAVSTIRDNLEADKPIYVLPRDEVRVKDVMHVYTHLVQAGIENIYLEH